MDKIKNVSAVLLAISLISGVFGLSATAYARLLTGPINGMPESTSYTWGDGIHDLTTQWSVLHAATGRGWFYGSDYPWGLDFYVAKGLKDPTTISNAAGFTYNKGSGIAEEGDTVFFRGANAYYGAWRIDDIYPPDSPPTYLNGQWYFQSDGTGNFRRPAAAPFIYLLLLK